MVAILQASLLAVAVAIAAAAMLPTPASSASYTVGNPGGSWDMQTNLTDSHPPSPSTPATSTTRRRTTWWR
nr:unnamed protein product [Digitaria exilis]